MTYICMCTGEDIGTVPAKAVCFKRVHIIVNNFTLCLSSI